VWGISYTNALANPRCRPPRAGESRRASAISLASPRQRWAAGTPAAASFRPRSTSNSAAARACIAAAADFSRSNSAIRAISAASSPFLSNMFSIVGDPPDTSTERQADVAEVLRCRAVDIL